MNIGMNVGIIIVILVLVCFFRLFFRNKDENDGENNNSADDNFDGDHENNKIEEQFFEAVNSGKEKYMFLKIDNQFDLMFIKSLFQSEHIPYYVEFENITKIRPGMYIGDLGNYNLLYILDEDYNDAVEVVRNYIEGKRDNTNKNENAKENIINIGEILIGNWKVPSASETNGIEIIYKENGQWYVALGGSGDVGEMEGKNGIKV